MEVEARPVAATEEKTTEDKRKRKSTHYEWLILRAVEEGKYEEVKFAQKVRTTEECKEIICGTNKPGEYVICQVKFRSEAKSKLSF